MTTETLPPSPLEHLRPLASLLAHPRVAIATALAVLLLGVPVAWLKGQPSYTASALVHVAPRYMKNARDDQEFELQSNTQYRQFVEQQVQTLRRADILVGAVHRVSSAGQTWQLEGESERRAAERLATVLRVGAVPDSYLIRVSLDGSRPEGLAVVVNAATTAYLEAIKREQDLGTDQRKANLRLRAAELTTELETQRKRREEIARQLGVSTFVENTLNPFDKLYVDARVTLAEASRKRIEAEARLAAFIANGALDPTLQSPPDVVALDAGLNALKANLYKRRAELISAQSGLGDQHPGAQAGRGEMAEINQELAAQEARLDGSARASVRAKLQSAVTLARSAEAELERTAEAQRLKSSVHATLYGEALAIGADIARIGKELDQLTERDAFFQTEANAPGFVYVAAPAVDPDMPSSGGRRKLLLLILAAALAAGLAAPVAFDLLARRLRAPREIEVLLGFKPIGWRTTLSTPGAARFNDEQLRRIAAALLRERDRHAVSSFCFAGCSGQASTTGLVFDLAQMFELLGVRTLVVEARVDARDARYDGAAATLCDLLLQRASATAVVAPRQAGLPARVRCGGDSNGLPALRRLGECLQELGEHYDVVLVDGAPVLASADAELVAAACRAAVLVPTAGTDDKKTIKKAIAVLERAALDTVGVVVEGVEPARAGGFGPELRQEISGESPAISTLLLEAMRRTFTRKYA